MKKLNSVFLAYPIFISVFMLILSSCGNEKPGETQNATEQEQQETTGITPEVIFENENAKVLKISLAPGEFQPTHEGESRVIYSLTDYSIDWEEKGEKLGTKIWKKGDVHFHEAGTHAAKNNGTTTAEWLVFAKKNTELADCGDDIAENDINSVSPDYAQTLFDNDEFRITEVKLPKGGSIPAHSGVNRVIYSLSDYALKYESDAEGNIDKQFKVGDVHWHQDCLHSLYNDGEMEAHYLVVSYKRITK